jgi:hypothetical protein
MVRGMGHSEARGNPMPGEKERREGRAGERRGQALGGGVGWDGRNARTGPLIKCAGKKRRRTTARLATPHTQSWFYALDDDDDEDVDAVGRVGSGHMAAWL